MASSRAEFIFCYGCARVQKCLNCRRKYAAFFSLSNMIYIAESLSFESISAIKIICKSLERFPLEASVCKCVKQGEQTKMTTFKRKPQRHQQDPGLLFQKGISLLDYKRHIFSLSISSFHPSAERTDLYTHICSKDINVSQVTSISQMLWVCFEAQGIPWQESRSTFKRNFPISKSALLDLNKRPGPTCLALVTPFWKSWGLVFSLARVLQTSSVWKDSVRSLRATGHDDNTEILVGTGAGTAQREHVWSCESTLRCKYFCNELFMASLDWSLHLNRLVWDLKRAKLGSFEFSSGTEHVLMKLSDCSTKFCELCCMCDIRTKKLQKKKKPINEMIFMPRHCFVALFARSRSLRLWWTMSNCKAAAFLHINTAPANREEKRGKADKMTAEWLSGLMHWNNLPGSPESRRGRQRDKIRREKGRW